MLTFSKYYITNQLVNFTDQLVYLVNFFETVKDLFVHIEQYSFHDNAARDDLNLTIAVSILDAGYSMQNFSIQYRASSIIHETQNTCAINSEMNKVGDKYGKSPTGI